MPELIKETDSISEDILKNQCKMVFNIVFKYLLIFSLLDRLQGIFIFYEEISITKIKTVINL